MMTEPMLQAGKQTDKPFPESFLFGVANSDSQCEAFVPEFKDIRDLWYERTQQTARGRATDFWNRFREDVELAKGLGCKMFRFSVSWARVEPQPGKWNQTALDHYSDVVDAIRAAGMEPMITLHHFVWPIHVEERGGMIADDFPSTFATYASQVVARMGNRVKYWITFNEPNILLFGYIKPWWEKNYLQPPGLPTGAGSGDQSRAQIRLMSNLFLAHTSARAAIRAASPSAMVGTNPSLLGLPPWLQRFIDRNVVNLKHPEDAERLGANLSMRKGLEAGKVDVVIATFTETDARESEVHFAEVYFVAHQRILVPAASPVQTRSDLAGKPVAVVSTSTAQTGIYTLLPTSPPVIVTHHVDAIKKLDSGAVSAFLADDCAVLPVMEANPGRYRLLDEVLSDEPYAPAVAQGSPQLLDAVDQAVRNFISSGQWAQSYRDNFGEPVPSPPHYQSLANLCDVSGTQVTYGGGAGKHADLLDRIRKRGSIRIAVRADRPGMGFRNPADGKWTGLEIDIARAIAVRIFGNDRALELVAVHTEERISFLRSISRWLDPLRKVVALITTSATTSWWNLGMAGKLQPFLCPPECVGQLDFVGMDYYWGLTSLGLGKISGLIKALAGGRMEQAPVYPQALYTWLKENGKMFPGKPLIIVENGCVEVASRLERAEYLRRHLQEVQKALADGVNVAAYVYWSITSNRELGNPFRPDTDFGLFHIELDKDPDLARRITPAAVLYQSVIGARSVPPS